MTTRKTATRQRHSARKPLALSKRTLRDLSARSEGPKGGFIMKDSIIVRTSGR